MLKPLALALALTVATTGAIAAEVSPQVRAAVAHDGRSAGDLDRDRNEHPTEILSFAGVHSGMTVADVFGGGGYYSELLSYAVGPAGTVLLRNNRAYDHFARTALADRHVDERLPNVDYRIVEATDLALPEASVDVALLTITYHDLFYADPQNGWPAIDRVDFLAQIYRALKPGGVLLVTDHRAEPGQGADVAQSLHRIDEDFARQQIELSGLSFDGNIEVLSNPDDDHTLSVFDTAIRGRTDRFVHRYVKPATG